MFLTADDKNVTYDKILKEVLEDSDDVQCVCSKLNHYSNDGEGG